MEFRITYQDVPFNYTTPHVLVIEAESKEQAFVTAYDHLTRAGHSVFSYPETGNRSNLDMPTIWFMGVPKDSHGSTFIRGIEVYAVAVLGKVKAGRS